jgi:hypothetical protein
MRTSRYDGYGEFQSTVYDSVWITVKPFSTKAKFHFYAIFFPGNTHLNLYESHKELSLLSIILYVPIVHFSLLDSLVVRLRHHGYEYLRHHDHSRRCHLHTGVCLPLKKFQFPLNISIKISVWKRITREPLPLLTIMILSVTDVSGLSSKARLNSIWSALSKS